MDQERSSGFRFRRPNSKLHKDPPQFGRALKSQQSNPSLKRHPSAPVYPRGHAGGREHTRTRSNAYGSSSSSVDQQSASTGHSPVLASGEFANSSSSHQTFKSRIGRFSFTNGKSADELISPPFDARGMPNVVEETDSSELDHQESSSETSQQRPTRLQSYHTSPPGGLQTLRQSASYSALQPRMDTALPPVQDASAAKRNSDDGNGPKSRRKGTFSNFVNSVLGSPRNIKISAPENPVHVTHVGYDNQTGQFTVRNCHLLSRSRLWFFQRLLLIEFLFVFCFRVYPRTGNECFRQVEFPRRNRSNTRRPWWIS